MFNNSPSFENILPGIVFRCKNDKAWTMLYMSENVKDILGYTMRELNHISFSRIIFSEHQSKVRDAINKAIKQKGNYKVAYSVTTKNGETLCLEEYGKPAFDKNGKLDYLEGYIHDITDAVESENKYKIQNKRLERAEDIGLTGNWEFDLNTKQVITSKGAQKIYELEDREYTIDYIQKIPLSKYRKPLNKALQELINGTSPYNIQFEIKGLKTGRIKTIHSIAQYSRSKNIVFGVIKDVSESVERLKNVRKIESSYKTLYDNVPNGIATFNSEGKVIVINQNAAQHMGGKADDFMGKKLWDFLDKRQADIIYERIIRCFQTAENLSYKNEVQVSGKTFAFLSKYSPVLNLNQEVESVQISSTDITDIQETNNKLQLLKYRLEIANQAVNNGIWDWDLKNDELYWDNLMYTIFGIEKGDVSLNYSNWENALLKEDLPHAKKELEKAINTKGILDIQFRINHPTKGIRYIRGFGKYIELDEPHLIGVNYDNTERVDNLIRIRRSEQQFRQLFEENNDIIAILSNEGKLQNINSKGIREFNIDPHNISDFSFASLILDHEEKIHSQNIINRLRKGEEVAPYYERLMGKNNKVKDYEVTLSPLYDSKHKLLQIVAIFRDISERIEYEKELLAQTQKALESDRLKTAFLMNMSHEIRTPLNAIMGFSDLLKSTELTEAQTKYLNYVLLGSKRIISTITDLLEASQLQQQQLKLDLGEFDIISLLSEVYFNSKELYQKEIETIDFVFNSNLKDDLTLYIDGERLKSILTRIISNAFKFTKEGSIVFECFKHDALIEINIKDTGAGIDPDKLRLIYDFFGQGDDSITRGYEGLGLGLPIAKGILELMNGTIEVISNSGIGTNISITIPIIQMQSNTTSLQAKRSIPKTESCNILLVEDDVQSEEYISLIIKNLIPSIKIARDGRSCKSLIDSNYFNLIFLDLKLPDISGLDLIPVIRKKIPDTYIVIQSAFANQSTIDEAIKRGADDYLTKPVNKKKVIEIVKQCSDGSSQ